MNFAINCLCSRNQVDSVAVFTAKINYTCNCTKTNYVVYAVLCNILFDVSKNFCLLFLYIFDQVR